MCLLISACSSNNKKDVPVVDQTIEKDMTGNTITPLDSGVVMMNLYDGKGDASIKKEADQTIYIKFEVDSYKKIEAHLSSPDSLANIRFSQIFLPNGEADGPFGRELSYDLTEDGIYMISVHENMMAGDPWSGIFDVSITLTK